MRLGAAMRQRGKLVILLSLVWFVLGTAYYSHRWSLLQFVILPIGLGMLTAIVLSFVWIFLDWKRVGWRSVLPFVICVLSLAGSFSVALRIREHIFEWSLTSYETMIQEMKSGKIVVSTNDRPDLVPGAKRLARLAHTVSACKDTNGVLTVLIVTEGGFPVSHAGYLYTSSGEITRGSPIDTYYQGRTQVRPNWFYVTY